MSARVVIGNIMCWGIVANVRVAKFGIVFLFQAEGGIRGLVRSRGLGDVYKRQERTLHRISAIRNRRGYIVGLTCRVGRAVYGTTDIIQDLIESGKSLLILGRPGVGKTTMLREAARILADSKLSLIHL